MDDFPGILARDLGFKPQGKSAPMAASKSSSATDSLNFGIGSYSTSSRSKPNWSLDHHDNIFAPSKPSSSSSSQDFSSSFNDVFGGPPKFNSQSSAAQDSSSSSSFNYVSIFHGTADSATSKSSSLPVYDKPVYDDDIFDGVPGLKTSSSVQYDDVFSSMSSPPTKTSAAFDDLLGNLGKTEPELKSSRSKKLSPDAEKDARAFDDLLSGFAGSSPSTNRSSSRGSQRASANSTKTTSGMIDDPFVVLESNSTPATSSGLFTDPLEEISKLSSSGSTKVNNSSTSRVFDDMDPLEGLGKSVPGFSSEMNNKVKDSSPLRMGPSMSASQSSVGTESFEKTSARSPESRSQKTTPGNSFRESQEPLFGMPTASSESHKPYNQNTSPTSYVNANPSESNSEIDTSPRSEDNAASSDDIWLTVSEIPLFTQPTSAPPPSRPPPPRPPKAGAGSFASSNSRKKVNEFSSFPNSTQYSQGLKSAPAAANPVVSQIDELEDFAMGRSRNYLDEDVDVLAGEDGELNSVAAAAMKEAMDRAEAKFKYAKEVRESECAKAARSTEAINLEKDEGVMQYDNERDLREKHERLDRERRQREREEEEREHRRLENERERAQELEREREEKEREQRRLERERQREIEREKARQAVERATREARERAAAEARLKAERAAVQRVQAEARERAAAEARERAEKAAAEAKERANAEAREREARLRAERAAVERAAAEARERAAAEARERAAAAARANQLKTENDLDSFFSMSSRPSSAPRPRANSSDPMFDMQSQNRQVPEAARRTSVGSSSSIRKASSTTNIVDDLSSIFGAPSSSGEFQEVEGETEERRRARLERHQRTQERAAKALAEKNQRDLQAQREQAERHRIAETLDVEIKRWAAGKEGNLRALLSTLQYVLWPECGWQPVSLTDLITAAAVKKVYRKATLCIHPDKVQQKGANLQQKYIAEKVFDLLKEAWNKFNSEELF